MRSLLAITLVLTLATTALAGRSADAGVEDNVWVSLDSNGVPFAAASGSFSYPPSLSTDGRFVAFETLATLPREGDSNGVEDVFLRDTGRASTGEDDPGEDPYTVRISEATDGAQANNRSYAPDMSADGRRIAFESLASNLVEGDGNNASDIFLRDLDEGTTARVSIGPDGADTNGASYNPAISGNGGFVAFCSRASNLVEGDTNGVADAFVFDRAAGTVTRIAVDGTTGGALEGCVSVAISEDGAVLAFSATVVDQTSVYVHDMPSGSTSNVTELADGTSGVARLAISGDGNVVAFDSLATNFVDGDTNRSRDVYAYDRAAQSMSRASVRSDGSQLPGDSGTSGVSISSDGHYVVFDSAARGVVPGDNNGRQDVFRHNLETGETTLASANVFDAVANDSSYSADINADGSVVAYTSVAGNIAYGDNNRQPDIFLRRTNFPATSGDGSGPVDTGAPEDGTLVPIEPTAEDNDIPSIALIGAAVGVGVIVLFGLSLLLGRRGKA